MILGYNFAITLKNVVNINSNEKENLCGRYSQ